MDDATVSVFDRIGLNAEQFYGVAFSSLAVTVLMLVESDARIQMLYENSSSYVKFTIVLTSGVLLFTVYRRIVGALLLFPAQHVLHIVVDCVFRRGKGSSSSPISYLWKIGVKVPYLRLAFEDVKLNFLSKSTSRQLLQGHGEVHLLYISSFVCAISFIWEVQTQVLDGKEMAIFGVMFLVLAIFVDTFQHIRSGISIRSSNKDELRKFLLERGYMCHMSKNED